MTFSPTSKQVVLHETFDESSEPTDDEIWEYAIKIGIDVNYEPDLLSLARDCLMQPLPIDWSPCYDADYPDRIYYFNFTTSRAQWVHPLEEVHQELVVKARLERKQDTISSADLLDEDSRTTAREDLRSFAEDPQSELQLSSTSVAMIPKPRLLEPLGPLAALTTAPVRGALRKPPDTLGLIKTATPATPVESKKVSFDDCEVKKRPNSSDIRNRRNIGPMEFRHLSKQEIMKPKKQWRDEGYATESSLTQPASQLTLSGGGAAFLKKLASKPIVEPTLKRTLFYEKTENDESKEDSNTEDEKNSVSLKLEKEIKVNFEIPKASKLEKSSENETGVSSFSEAKQIEIDFEDLKIDLDLNMPKEKEPALLKNVEYPESLDKSSRSVKKFISIVLNEQISNDSSQDDKKSDNLIDLTDVESVSTVESKPGEGAAMLTILSDLENMLKEPTTEKKLRDEPENLEVSIPAASKINDAIHVSAVGLTSQTLKNNVEEGREIDNVLEKTKANLDYAKAEKLKALEGEYNVWVKNTEKMFREKEKQCFTSMMERHEDWRKNEENGMIKEMGEKCAEELQAKVKSLRNELLREEQESMDALRTSLAVQSRDRLRALREEMEAREEREIAELKKDLDEGLKKRKEELYKKHDEEMKRLERSLEAILAEQRQQRQQELEKAREDESALAAMRAQLKDAFMEQKTIVQQEHEMALHKLRQQHEIELFQAANNRLTPGDPSADDTTRSGTTGKDASDPRTYEKLRCEKRLLEDKYKNLKEKYIRLKTDVKISLEKKGKKKEVTEIEKSQPNNKCGKAGDVGVAVDSPEAIRKAQLNERLKAKKLNHLDNVNQNISPDNACEIVPKNVRGELSQGMRLQAEGVAGSSGEEADYEARAATRKRRQFFSKLKAASTSKLNSAHRNHDDPLSPVENLRRQLKKLEELEDQFPVTPQTDTYLRYPFTDATAPHFVSSELEFFKHRIHLERDAVRRAKEFLKAQKKCYENRQRELQHRLMDGGPSSKSILEKIHKEERDLTEMEVSVHRTRALLGEKIIRLRHLEQSLRRAAPPERHPDQPLRRAAPPDLKPRGGLALSRDDPTLSDLSSHSDSSGFSSTHYTSEPLGPRHNFDKNKRHLQTSMQESNEIIQSLENLNSEIHGIWEVLKQSSGPGAVQLPPPPLAWPAVRTNPTAGLISPRPLTQMKTQVTGIGHVTTLVDTSLIDRTRSLRDWLKSAKRSPNPDPAASNQVTL